MYFSTLYMSGYYQLEIAPEDKKKTAFITKFGLFEHIRMSFGLCNEPATFQRAIQFVLRGLTWRTVIAYLDDVNVLGKDFDEHIQNLADVFEGFQQHNLKLKPRKCSLMQTQCEFLGKHISREGVSISPKKNWHLLLRQKYFNYAFLSISLE